MVTLVVPLVAAAFTAFIWGLVWRRKAHDTWHKNKPMKDEACKLLDGDFSSGVLELAQKVQAQRPDAGQLVPGRTQQLEHAKRERQNRATIQGLYRAIATQRKIKRLHNETRDTQQRFGGFVMLTSVLAPFLIFLLAAPTDVFYEWLQPFTPGIKAYSVLGLLAIAVQFWQRLRAQNNALDKFNEIVIKVTDRDMLDPGEERTIPVLDSTEEESEEEVEGVLRPG